MFFLSIYVNGFCKEWHVNSLRMEYKSLYASALSKVQRLFTGKWLGCTRMLSFVCFDNVSFGKTVKPVLPLMSIIDSLICINNNCLENLFQCILSNRINIDHDDTMISQLGTTQTSYRVTFTR